MSEQILKEILGELKALNQRVGSLEDGQQELKTGQQKLETGQQKLETGQQKLETGQQKLETGQQKLETGQSNMEASQQELKSDVSDLKKGQLHLETRLENEAFNKIGALFDGHSLRGDQIENLQKHLDQRLDSIEIDTRYLVSRVARLEKLAK